MVFLDTSVVIYLVEQPALWGPKAAARVGSLRSAGEEFAVTDLVRMECLVGPFKAGDKVLEADYASFFGSPGLKVLSITAAVCDRAAGIRALRGFKPLDALHLAAALEHGCNLFLTNDGRLASFPDVTVEILS